jgi:hypothetical protein
MMRPESVVDLLYTWVLTSRRGGFVPGPYVTDINALRWFVDGYLACHNIHGTFDLWWDSFVLYLSRNKVTVMGEDVFDSLLVQAAGDASSALAAFYESLCEYVEGDR